MGILSRFSPGERRRKSTFSSKGSKPSKKGDSLTNQIEQADGSVKSDNNITMARPIGGQLTKYYVKRRGGYL